MNQEWILQIKETRRTFSNATWIPLRANDNDENGKIKKVGYYSEYFGCGSVAFPPEHRKLAEERLGWSDIGIGHTVAPYAYEDGYYATIDQYQYNDKEPIGVNLVFEHPQPVVGGKQWILNPDLVVALRLIKDGTNWVRPEEDFVVVAREHFDKNGEHRLIEIKREFLIDYLAARNLSLRLSYYRQRVENVPSLEGSEYAALKAHEEERNSGRFELRISNINDVFGGSWAIFRAWRTDVDEDEDAPVMGPENDHNTGHESSTGERGGYEGVRVEGEFWRDEWIDHQAHSVRVRGDTDTNLPQFIVATDGKRMASSELNNEDIGRWLWFRSSVVTDLLGHRGFALRWCTAETGKICSTSGYATHFGINSADLITVYAYDIARLAAWEQHVWAANNVAPEGKVSSELLMAQVKAEPASTHAVEELFFTSMRMLEQGFRDKFGIELFSHDIDDESTMQQISRFHSKDQASLLRLAKDLVRVFSDRLNVRGLRKIATHADKDKLGSNKLLQDILSQKIGADKARQVFAEIAGVYDMRVGDAHPTGSKITDAIKLAGIDQDNSFLIQGQQLIHNFGRSIWYVGKFLFGQKES
ncbi:hypothetical protein [Aeromonas hydrophila]|uniref:hypothetical protein n=1 Tax=Aeromonas hydrophila TaxID=644 RepID=UPI0007602FF3|nr:hypothetical protein [Aeromonas hydrophila]KWR68860.1 hypothetical protein ATO50_06740 [Aeromonas hydrophila]HAU4927528.1 hypothetical protein [Aeromonas hydrophila]